MLSAILKKEDCAKCRFCCSFRRQSLWETPIFTAENITAIKNDKDKNSECLIQSDGIDFARYDLSGSYISDDSDEEVKCPYLGENGCILDNEEKPWDCKIWPLRVMKTNDSSLVIALTPTCPEINKLDIETVKTFVKENLSSDLFKYAQNHPCLIKDYREDFPVIDKAE